MKEKIAFLKNSGIYFLGDFLSKLIIFFLIPLYSKYIPPKEFGYFDIVNAYVFILVPLFTFEIWVGMIRFIKNEKDASKINKIITNGLLMSIFTIFFIVIGFFVNRYFLKIEYYNLICIYYFLYMVQKYYLYLCRAIDSNKNFVVSGLLNTIVTLISSYFMLVYLDMTLISLFLSNILGFLVQIIYLEFKIKLLKRISFRLLDTNLLKELILFSVPLCLGSILYYFLLNYNKIIIEQILGLNANGIYAISSKFTLIILFITSAATLAWQDLSFSIDYYKTNNLNTAKIIEKYMKIVLSSCGVIIFLIHFIFPHVINKQYFESYSIIPLCIIVAVLASIGNFISQTLGAIKKTKIILYSSLISTIYNVIFLNFFIKNYGLNGVSMNLIITYLIIIFIRIFYLKYNHNIKINSLVLPFSLVFLFLSSYIFIINKMIYNVIGLIISISALSYFVLPDLLKIVSKLKNNK